MSTSFLDTLILLGAIQGFITATLLFVSKRNKTSAKLLGWVVLLMSMCNLNLYLDGKQFPNNSWFNILFNIIPLVVVMPMGPLIYYYTKSSLDKDYKVSKRDKRHYFALIIDIVPQLIVIFYLIALVFGINRKYGPMLGFFIDEYNVYSDIPRWASVTTYVLLAYAYLKKAGKSSSAAQLNANFKWLKTFLTIFVVFQVIWFLYLVPYVIPSLNGKLMSMVDWYPVYIPLTILIYIAGIRGYIQVQQEVQKEKKEVATIQFTGEVANDIISRLETAMQKDKLYLDPSLNLANVSAHIAIPHKTISAVLNQHLGKSFNEFVNEYRVSEIKSRLLQTESEKFTIAGLAYECGFNSQPTFQRAFKSITGKTPTEFLSTYSELKS